MTSFIEEIDRKVMMNQIHVMKSAYILWPITVSRDAPVLFFLFGDALLACAHRDRSVIVVRRTSRSAHRARRGLRLPGSHNSSWSCWRRSFGIIRRKLAGILICRSSRSRLRLTTLHVAKQQTPPVHTHPEGEAQAAAKTTHSQKLHRILP